MQKSAGFIYLAAEAYCISVDERKGAMKNLYYWSLIADRNLNVVPPMY